MKTYSTLFLQLISLTLLFINTSFKNQNTNAVSVNDDYAEVSLNKTEIINIIENDYGFADGISSLKLVEQPEHGTVLINEDHSISYTPEINFTGEDRLVYEICNMYGDCGTGTVEINTIYKDYIPVAINDTISTYWTMEKMINCCANDSNLLNFPIELNIETAAEKGDCYTLNDTTIIYAPGKGYSGADSIQYSVIDEDGDYSSAWIIINLLSNDSSDDIFIPNGFSPNGDGINDFFTVPDFENASNVHLSIFTQWGDIIYENKDYKNDWDGIANSGSQSGSKVNVGTYFYRFIVADLDLDLKGYIYINF
ncbi:Ig-like domain-containing protein [Plebeiibacterium sediminum]|uniref:Gliding motility-associated C-terminal domain-containing protein n=1 Tax=Plebeiibacterium sediminum TaxID=2992112 RepID=A0AAE3M3J2_9BACT|nr:gliding motility-associated C-terminal domain-containing protein [Plebeiobacterium sediminum]MCW3786413.1 gliding motility-associated C-terminal domain-containing protein [Plebeiobacterium sediminum]